MGAGVPGKPNLSPIHGLSSDKRGSGSRVWGQDPVRKAVPALADPGPCAGLAQQPRTCQERLSSALHRGTERCESPGAWTQSTWRGDAGSHLARPHEGLATSCTLQAPEAEPSRAPLLTAQEASSTSTPGLRGPHRGLLCMYEAPGTKGPVWDPGSAMPTGLAVRAGHGGPGMEALGLQADAHVPPPPCSTGLGDCTGPQPLDRSPCSPSLPRVRRCLV